MKTQKEIDSECAVEVIKKSSFLRVAADAVADRWRAVDKTDWIVAGICVALCLFCLACKVFA